MMPPAGGCVAAVDVGEPRADELSQHAWASCEVRYTGWSRVASSRRRACGASPFANRLRS